MDKRKDRFCLIYQNLNEKEVNLITEIKETAQKIADLFEKTEINREISLAFTNLEQAIMWAIKGICINHEVSKID